MATSTHAPLSPATGEPGSRSAASTTVRRLRQQEHCRRHTLTLMPGERVVMRGRRIGKTTLLTLVGRCARCRTAACASSATR